ncbi:hypothetical protein CASFOL_034263 [Castilleja foliolosa]|uniref:Uncharacterized protein n=1 Tax=Castilleja foliolosa TaxID=1961234 RepID=A0ABD3BZM1_9LAMI
MTISLEALAMSGANFLEVGLDMEEWEQMDSEVPDYLLAEEEEDNEKKGEQDKTNCECLFQSFEDNTMKYYVSENENEKDSESVVDVERNDLISKCWSYAPLKLRIMILLFRQF